MNPPDDLVDDAVDRVLALLAEPLLVRRALAEVRSPSRSLACAITDDTAWSVSGWRPGRAVVGPGLLVFRPTAGGGETRLDVRTVVATRYVRRRSERETGPRRLGVLRLQTPVGPVWCSAHRRVLDVAADVLGADAAPSGSGPAGP